MIPPAALVNGQHDGIQRVPLIEMESSLHRNYIYPRRASEYKIAGMPRNAALRHAVQRIIGNDLLLGKHIRRSAPAAAQNNANTRASARTFLQLTRDLSRTQSDLFHISSDSVITFS